MIHRAQLASSLIFLLCFAACNYTDGECFPRDEMGDVTGGGGSIILTGGAGGFGDTPPEPPRGEDPNAPPECNLAASVRCEVPASPVCVEQCADIGAYCGSRSAHPYSPSSGGGELYWCKGGKPTWTCSYKYSNGDNCTIIYPLGKWFCLYDSGQ